MKYNTSSWHFRGVQTTPSRRLCPLCRRSLFWPGIRSGRRLADEVQRAASRNAAVGVRVCRLEIQPTTLADCLVLHSQQDAWRRRRIYGRTRLEYGVGWRTRADRELRLQRVGSPR